jgi:hypothetical protein
MKIGGRCRQLAFQRNPAGRFNDLLARRAPDARGDCSAIGVPRTAVLVRIETEVSEPRQESGGQGAWLELLNLRRSRIGRESRCRRKMAPA